MTYPRKFQRIEPSEKAKAFARAEVTRHEFNCCFLHEEKVADCPWCSKQAEKQNG